MTSSKCGCSSSSCGCCEGTSKITPVSTVNRPGLDLLNYRIGTHGSFLETMKARLANLIVEASGPDGQTIEKFYPLQDLTTRDTSDPSIALLDGWATVGDVLTFYQERIANEGYLRTASERRSLVELARLIGYKPRPGVASTVYLAYTLEDTQVDPVEIPAGARSQSIPGPDELPQSFETSESLIARREWNNLQVRLQRPQNITLDNVLLVDKIYGAGLITTLKTGDTLLLVFGEGGEPSALRTVASIESQFEKDRTEIRLQPLSEELAVAVPLAINFIKKLRQLVPENSAVGPLVLNFFKLLEPLYHGGSADPHDWVEMRATTGGAGLPAEVQETIDDFQTELAAALDNPSETPIQVTNPSQFVSGLLKRRNPQVTSSLRLPRDLKLAFGTGTDASAQMLVNMQPELKENFYTAWSNANLTSVQPSLIAVYIMRLQAPLFGANAQDQPTFEAEGQLKPRKDWIAWDVADDEQENALYLDQAYEEILPSTYVVIHNSAGRQVLQVIEAQTIQRTAYGMSGKTTRLTFAENWWSFTRTVNETPERDDIDVTIRNTLVYAQSEELTLVDAPITDVVQVTEEVADEGIELDGLYNELTSGRWIILSGERVDIPNVSGIKGTELLMISGLRQVEPAVSGDTIHTALLLATPTAYSYKRETLTVYGNVVKATHGETTNEPLGSGDGSQALQSFELKQPPLTFVPAPNASGIESTLNVYVDNVEWHEADALFDLGPRDRKFTTKTADDDKTTVIFGNGKQGSRLPTGVLNVTSVYRRGIGKPGNVKPEQISLLQTKPLGVKSVINPLRASGGADKEDADQIRENAPVAVMALDRLVSLQDYSDFTRNFAGIAKVNGLRLSDGARQFIHLTIAGADDAPIDPVSDLYQNLTEALTLLGDVSVAVQIESRELIVLVLSANIQLEPDYLWEPVATKVRAALFEKFGFRKRALGQPALLCEIVGCIQSIKGVAYVDVDAFGGVPEKVTGTDGTRRLLTLEEISATVQQIVTSSTPSQSVLAGIAGYDNGALRAAQLAIFTANVPDTVVLNQIT